MISGFNLQAHKLVLVCASEFFKACLRDNNFEQYYHFSNISLQGMEGILNFLYGEHHKIEPKNYPDVLEAAAIFAVPFATAFFKDKVNETNTVENYERSANTNTSNPQSIKKEVTLVAEDMNESRTDVHQNEMSISSKHSKHSRNAETSGLDNLCNRTVTLEQVSDSNLTRSRKNKLSTFNKSQSETEYSTSSHQTISPNDIQQQAIEDRKRLLTRTLPTCNVCGKRFLRIGFLKRHKERKHNRNRDKRVYKCEFCPKVCRTAKDIKLHRRRHTGTSESFHLSIHILTTYDQNTD